MKDFISELTNSFSQFLTDVTARSKENLSGCIISFSKEIPGFDFDSRINQLLKSGNSFYFSSPDQLSLIGLDKVFSIVESGQGRFAAIDKKIKDISSRFFNNWSENKFPLFVGAMKFTVEHSDDVWKDFKDSEWFVPEIVFLKDKKKNYFLYNHFTEQGLSKTRLTEKFKNKIENIFKNSSEKNSTPSPRIINSSGLLPKDKKKWKRIINQVLEHIYGNEIKKVVLARKVELILSEEINISSTINSLSKDYPNCYIFAFRNGKSTFFGATPELLTKISGGQIEVDAIAGSIERGESEAEDIQLEKKLSLNKKDLEEHRYVLDQLKISLKNIGEDLTFNETPSVKKLKNIQHLVTKMTAKINNGISIMSILKELHPTPAVCGFPKDTALNLIKKLESQRRGLYSGIIGWFNLYNEGEFAVAIRSAVTTANKLAAYAGGGIVEGSEPDAEFEETEIKLKPILSLFNEKN